MANEVTSALAEKVEKRVGIDELRWLVSFLNSNRESFNQRFSAEELLQIGRMHAASGWDIYPDAWMPWQVADALNDIVPKWDDEERPVLCPSALEAMREALGVLLVAPPFEERNLAVKTLQAAIDREEQQ